MDIQAIFEPVTTIGLAVVGWWVKGIRDDFKELKQELQHYTHKDTCQAHRDGIQAQIDAIRKEAEVSLAHAVNDTRRMQSLYDHMTPAERHEHAAKCLFKHDMEGIG